MKCPVCGTEMESGTLHTQKYPGWTSGDDVPVFRKAHGTIQLRPKGDNPPSMWMNDPLPLYPETQICKACKIVIFQYE